MSWFMVHASVIIIHDCITWTVIVDMVWKCKYSHYNSFTPQLLYPLHKLSDFPAVLLNHLV